MRTKPVNDAEKWPPNGTTEQLLGDDSQLLLTSHRISYTGQGHYREVVTN